MLALLKEYVLEQLRRSAVSNQADTGQPGADGQVVRPHVVQVLQRDHVNVTAMTNFA